MRASGIYKIEHLASGRIYVGSAVSLHIRWNEHRAKLRTGRHENPRLQNAWTKYGEQSFAFSVLEFVEDRAMLVACEQRWIDELTAFTKPNFNINPRADSRLGTTLSADARAKISISSSRPRKPLSAEHRMKISALKKGHKMHPNTRLAIAKSHVGRVISNETRNKISAVHKGKVVSPEARLKMSSAAKNRTPEHLAKISAALTGRKMTPDGVMKIKAGIAKKKALKLASTQH